MAILSKYISGLVAALAALLCPITPLIITATLFIAIDFVTGICASCVAAKNSGQKWRIESRASGYTRLDSHRNPTKFSQSLSLHFL